MSLILIAEDEELIRENLCGLFAENGFQVCSAADGTKALDEINTKDFTLICLDIRMPGLSGMELVKEIRKTKETPILVITGNPDDIDPEIESEVDGYIQKPYKDEDVLHVVAQLIET